MEPPPATFNAPAALPASSLPSPVAPPPQLRPPASSVTPAAPPASAVVRAAPAVGVKRQRAGQHIVLPSPPWPSPRSSPLSPRSQRRRRRQFADLRYKEMAALKGKAFPFKHVWKILQTYDKWKLRDQETAPKKSAMLRMDDSEEEGRNEHKPAGNKKDKLRKKMEGDASSIKVKIEHMMKSKEALTMKTLKTKLLINEKKKEVKLAQVEARREDAMCKADLEERMIKVKEAKAWKKLMVKEKEHMMMSKKDMDEDQLMWWKEYKEDIAERKRIFRDASSTLRGDTLMSGGGDCGVEDSTTGDNGGA
ncbi:putative methionyl-tRNA synthetase [Hordeum vulgare]|nr:putative methionyl-tRNA synthetase [Hordeum vulgare]